MECEFGTVMHVLSSTEPVHSRRYGMDEELHFAKIMACWYMYVDRLVQERRNSSALTMETTSFLH